MRSDNVTLADRVGVSALKNRTGMAHERYRRWVERHHLEPYVRWINWETIGLPLMIVLVGLVFALLNENFLTYDNLGKNVARQVAALALISWGQTIVILSAGIDLSVGSVVAMVSVMATMSMQSWGAPWLIVVGLLVGVGAGLFNGILIGRIGLAPFIATLGMLSIARGIALSVSGGVPIFDLPDTSLWNIGNGYILWGSVPTPVLIALGGFLLTWILLYRTRFGTYVYAVGGNEESAKLAGVNVVRVKVLIYAFAGLLTGVGGLVLTARVRSGQPLLGEGLELQSIAAVVIGGVSLFGGQGRLIGTFWGVILIGILSNGLNIVGISTFIQQIVIGTVIILAVTGTTLFRKRE